MQKTKGFTLIELLVVIFIIGLLATIVVIATTTARSNARDNRRKTDLNSIALALEAYKAVNKEYVQKDYWPDRNELECGGSCDYVKADFLKELVEGNFMTGPAVPNDPMYDSYVDDDGTASWLHAFTYQSSARFLDAHWGSTKPGGYELYGWLENSDDADVTKPIGSDDGFTQEEDGHVYGLYMLVK